MTPPEKIHFKNRLKGFAIALIGQRMAAAKEAIDQAQQAANQEEKSSAGDKYETGRAMGHLQKDMLAKQLVENTKELATLHAVTADKIYPAAAPGAFIECEEISFFIAAGLGKQIIEEHTIYFLSPHAPLARLLQGKKAGEQFFFNTVNTTIADVY